MMQQTSKNLYRQWCEEHPEIPLFLQYDWIVTVARSDQWDVAVVEKGGQLQAFMPYFKKKKLGFDIITMPPLTPYMGPWIHYPEDQKTATRGSFEKKVLGQLITQLPRTDKFIQYFHPESTNWLPFYWKGFRQSTRYTYMLDDLSNADQLYRDLQGNIRREIAKSQRSLTVHETDEVSTLYKLKELSSDVPNHSFRYLDSIFQKLRSKRACKVWNAIDGDGTPISSLFLVWDAECAYYLAGATDPSHKNTGAMSLLMWTAILYSSSIVSSFNFEGSMMEPIERFFRSFGAHQVPYFEISRTDSKLLKLL